MMSSDKFSDFGSVVCIFLREASEIGFILHINGVDSNAVTESVVTDEPLLMSIEYKRIFLDHITKMIFLLVAIGL